MIAENAIDTDNITITTESGQLGGRIFESMMT
jgi:hypothetical protein